VRSCEMCGYPLPEQDTYVSTICCYCHEELMYEEKFEQYQIITKEMAMDAECPELEGEIWK
jgi:hypothetical protein